MVQRREAVRVEDDFGEWTPITVHLSGEILPRNRIRPYKGSMFAAYPRDIVFSRIDARSGAIGMLVLRTGSFIEALRQRASGTSGRKRITPKAFQDLRIPLPPLDEQRKIVAAHRAGLDHATALEREADETGTRYGGVRGGARSEAAAASPRPAGLRAFFKDLDRWSHEAILRRTAADDTARELPYPILQLGDVIADLENGWSPKCHDRPPVSGAAEARRSFENENGIT